VYLDEKPDMPRLFGSVDLEIAWQTVQHYIPQLEQQIQSLVSWN
jgi:uncharacterized protein with HEPN domain